MRIMDFEIWHNSTLYSDSQYKWRVLPNSNICFLDDFRKFASLYMLAYLWGPCYGMDVLTSIWGGQSSPIGGGSHLQ